MTKRERIYHQRRFWIRKGLKKAVLHCGEYTFECWDYPQSPMDNHDLFSNPVGFMAIPNYACDENRNVIPPKDGSVPTITVKPL